jgi:hypothetical protein
MLSTKAAWSVVRNGVKAGAVRCGSDEAALSAAATNEPGASPEKTSLTEKPGSV